MKTLWILLCTACCAVQVAILTVQYLGYEISSTVSFTFDKLIDLPAISLCVRLPHVIDWGNPIIRKDCNNILDIDCSNRSNDELISYVYSIPVIQGLKIEANLYRLFDGHELVTTTLPIESLIAMVMHGLGNTTAAQAFSRGKVSDFFKTIEFISRHSKCFTMKWKMNFTQVYRSNIRRGFFSPGLLWILSPSKEFHRRFDGYMYAYSSLSNPNVGNGVSSILLAITRAATTSTFDLFRNQLLEAPFTTDCLNYMQLGFIDQNDCFDSCMTQLSLQKFGKKMMGQTLVKQDRNIKAMTMAEVRIKWQENNQVFDYCLKACPKQDCKQTIYSSRTTASALLQNMGTDMLFYAPLTPSVVSESSAKITLTEYLVVSASCFGFWFGMSILRVLTGATRMTRKIMRFYRQHQKERRNKRKIQCRNSIRNDGSFLIVRYPNSPPQFPSQWNRVPPVRLPNKK